MFKITYRRNDKWRDKYADSQQEAKRIIVELMADKSVQIVAVDSL